MAYNSKNHHKRVKKILEVYEQHKNSGLPDTQIVNNIFPQHGINISYSTWMSYKGIKPSQLISA